MQHFGEVLTDIVMPDLQTSETESTLELNFFIGKLKHTVKRVRKENPDKREIITMIFDLFRETAIDEDPMENVVMANPERQIDFHYKGESYSITLTQHRKPNG